MLLGPYPSDRTANDVLESDLAVAEPSASRRVPGPRRHGNITMSEHIRNYWTRQVQVTVPLEQCRDHLGENLARRGMYIILIIRRTSLTPRIST